MKRPQLYTRHSPRYGGTFVVSQQRGFDVPTIFSSKKSGPSKKLLIVCGPTATGKTSLAFKLAKQFNGEIISADSRQVYKFMDVITGKDLPTKLKTQNSKLKINSRSIPFYEVDEVKLWGYDVVKPDEEWSVKLFQDFANIVIADIYKRGKLPIVVGGTGLYLKALTEPIPLISIPRNLTLRKKLENKSATELYAMLLEKNRRRALSMNKSDRQNPRRLIRAIEVAEAEKVRPWHAPRSDLSTQSFDALWIGLTITDRNRLYQRIDKRVDQRITPQLWGELEFLKKKGFLRGTPNVTIGYRQLIPYLAQEISKEESIQRWKFAEHDYARRQSVWFKKQPNIHWFDITNDGYQCRVVTLIRQWYDQRDART